MNKPKLQKKWINWQAEQFDITHADSVQMCREGYSEHKSWMKKRHFKKQEQN